MKAKSILLVLGILVLVVLVLLSLITVLVYEMVFHHRYQSGENEVTDLESYPSLLVEECRFPAKGGHTLAGYHYSRSDVTGQIKGVLVFAHGLGGGGHRNYRNLIHHFAGQGYLVFSYDVTGNDQSEGSSVQGLPRGVMDLDYALRYVKQETRYEGLPIVLMGHSWGGYSVGAVLNYHPDVKAVVSMAGFDRSADMILQQGREIVGGAIGVLSLFVSVYEWIKFGSYTSASAAEGYAESEAAVLILHSSDDMTVRAENGYDKYYARFTSDSRFAFRLYSMRGHNHLYYTEGAESLDEELMEQITTFYDTACGA